MKEIEVVGPEQAAFAHVSNLPVHHKKPPTLTRWGFSFSDLILFKVL
jgi:hypothetical protein